MKIRDLLHKRHKLNGFTLVELMVTVAIVAILMAVGAPQLRGFLQKQQVAADVESLTSAIHMARSEALKRSGRVSICALNADDFAVSTKAVCAGNAETNWSNGWLIYIDYSNGAGYASTTDTVLQVERTVRSGSITGTNGIISFLANGLTASDNGSLIIKPKGTADTDPACKKWSLSRQGRFARDTTTTGCVAPVKPK